MKEKKVCSFHTYTSNVYLIRGRKNRQDCRGNAITSKQQFLKEDFVAKEEQVYLTYTFLKVPDSILNVLLIKE